MHVTPRPPATQQEAMWAMDRLIATHLVGQQEMAQLMGLNVTDVTCFGFVIAAGRTSSRPVSWRNASTSPPAR